MHVIELFIRALDQFPDKPVLIGEFGTITYSQLYRMMIRNMANFSQNSIQANDRVVIYALNGPEFLAAYFALSYIGAIPVTIGPKSTIAEIQKMCASIDTYKIVVDQTGYHVLRKHLSGYSVTLITADIGTKSWGKVKPPSSAEYGQIRFTSGTTGQVKPVLLSQKNLTWRLEHPGTHCLSEDVFVCCIPFTYRIIKVLLAIGMGATIISMKTFAIKTLLAYLERYQITWLWGTPGIYQILIEGIDRIQVFRGLRGASSLGSYLSPRTQELFQNKFGCNIYQNYGLAEAMDSTEMPADQIPILGSAGKIRHGVEIDFCNIQDEQGEIFLRGPNVMMGYLYGEQISDSGIENGWLRTGDLGYIDKNGYLYITGRNKVIINVDGLKVTPYEIESVLYQLPGVSYAEVIGKTDALRGEIPVAYIKLDKHATLSKTDVKRHCMERLSLYKVPRQIEFIENITLKDNGKFNQRSYL
ncbi:3-[(3aS,4S,7aS)-7a-methyl-1,5-dioxo-octahydro-1H-inden-4-yl]propanoyl:CoA ligase [bioreactor metagenome]|uniref:3-[(3aS,4S,7aS)-7a-methyl-1, 5-dioxo-octahydro-1H-inden-4-yl]propanoyl:CoA ligase n=1 Tax=bioreactor metagenome TaxID=1076179 RepID=A0A644SUN4_9ZZZZ